MTIHDGRQIKLSEVYPDAPFALIFLRHLGCVFCREQVKEMAQLEGWNIAFVAMAEPEEAAQFREKMGSLATFICDPEAELYQKFSLERGSMKQVLGASNWKRGFQAMFKGNGVGAPVGDPFRLGGAFVMANGKITWEHRNRDAADNVRTIEVGRALQRTGLDISLEAKV